jgi:UDP-N-acetylglucosamine transferase subunit ALG13
MILILTGTQKHPMLRLINTVNAVAAVTDATVIFQGSDCVDARLSTKVVHHEFIKAKSLTKLFAVADTVISHAGTGTLIQSIKNGHKPIIAIREAQYGEHVDDHQSEIAQFFFENDLGTRLDLNNPYISRTRDKSIFVRARKVFDGKLTDEILSKLC